VFETARAQELPFPDATFDAVLVTLTLHHLPTAALRECVSEIRRVLKPAGRLLAVDIGGPQDGRRTPHAHHGRVHWDLDALVPLLAHAGLNEVESGAVEFRLARFERLRYVLAAAA
jgi:ubiquinone/menaquinone biosynthesis C-methylase UbiE